ncbi:MAG TPA: peptide ABC transporter substrate-binding protein [Steroidobacteraceae bacterium]|nr:peptide ABC transporter substrate-binding protein [Steroidobacteraceae bacterium]
MSYRRRAAWPLLVALALALPLAGCNASRDGAGAVAGTIRVGDQPAAEQVLYRTLDSAPQMLDPSLAADTPSQAVVDDLFEGLTTLDSRGRVVPGVASSWEASPDGLSWVFHLRPEARWSNGEPLTAADFVYAWRRTTDPATRAEYAQALAPLLNGMEVATGKKPPTELGVTALNAHTLRVQLAGPTPYLPQLLTNMYLVPLYAPVIRRFGDDWTRAGNIVSDGPFVLAENVIGSRLTLEKNPHYWDAAHVKLQRVVYFAVDDRAAQAQRFLAGQVQYIMTFPTTDLPYLRAHLGDQVVTGPYFGNFKIGINVTRAPFKGNRALRLALSIAVDREMIAEHVLSGAGFPAYNLIPPLDGYAAQLPDWAHLTLQARHELARRYYHEAGYSAAHPLRVEMSFPSGDPVTTLTYEAVAAMWRDNLGAEVSLHVMEFKVLLQEQRLKKPLLFHDAWIGDFLDPFTFLQLYTTGFELNHSGYENPAFDALLEQARIQPQVTERYRYFEQAERMLNDDGAYIPIYFYSVRHLVKPYLSGWAPNIEDRNLSRYMFLLEHEGN